jgi:hypothetical protein
MFEHCMPVPAALAVLSSSDLLLNPVCKRRSRQQLNQVSVSVASVDAVYNTQHVMK